MSNVKLRRIIRHGTSYGPPLPDGVLDDDGQKRGIMPGLSALRWLSQASPA